MDKKVKNLINQAVLEILKKTGSKKKISKMLITHTEKTHFIPIRYRVFGGLLQSMNIQFGNFIEVLMALLIDSEDKYEIIEEYSGKKSNSFELSEKSERMIDSYITRCQTVDVNIDKEFPRLLEAIVADNGNKTEKFKHDIDLLFKDKTTGIIYYLEIKYNDDHDTGKFVDINRKFIKTYAYLVRELDVDDASKLVPMLFFFTNKKLKGNIYVPEKTNIRRRKKFFEEFLSVDYDDVDSYMSNLSESKDVVKMFDELYEKVMDI